MQKKIIIIGGGITGCIASLYAKKKGYSVELFEKSKELGGVLKDDFDNNFFFSGCQYFNPKSSWFKLIEKFEKEFLYFKANYGSYTNLKSKEEIAVKYFPGPVFKLTNIDNQFNKKINKTLVDRIDCYSSEIQKLLKCWLESNKINFQNLHYLSSIPLAINRVSTNIRISNLKEDKKQNKFIDQLYGLPRDVMGFNYIESAIPKKGYTNFFKLLKKYLIEKEIKVNTSSLVKLKKNDNSLEVYNFDKMLTFDYILWCASPTPVIARLDNMVLNTEPLKITNYCFKYNGQLPNFYLQVFNKSKIFRISCFSVQNNNQIIAECFDDEIRLEYLIIEIKRLLKFFEIFIDFEKLKYFSKFKKKRYTVISDYDYKAIQNFKKNKKMNFVDGSWDSYSRDDKIKKVINNIDKLN